jgi:hypothetical protein
MLSRPAATAENVVDEGRRLHDLAGVRLGKVERWLLVNASSPERLSGLILNAHGESRSAQGALLRGARKLSRLGLLEIERVPTLEPAQDPRRLEPHYRDGAFYRWRDPTRLRLGSRRGVWLSPFGVQIQHRYAIELREGRSIRWDPAEIRHATEVASRYPFTAQYQRRSWLEQRRRELKAELNETKGEPTVPVVPSFLASDEDRRRWRIAVARAATENPRARSRRLWEAAVAIYRSADSTEALIPPIRTTATDPFLKTPVPYLR